MTIQAQVIDLLVSLKKKNNSALLFIGHDLSVVSAIADDVVVLKNGHIVEKNNVRDFFRHPQQEYSRQLLDAVLPSTVRKNENTQDRADVLLSVDHLKLYFPVRAGILKRIKNYVKAVDDISFIVKTGKTLALVGESGSGKTTTAKAVLQLIKNTAGDIIFEDKKMRELSATELRKLRSDMQIIFQDPCGALNPRMIIFDSLCEGLIIQKKIRHKKEAIPIIDHLLAQVELTPEMKWRYPHEFSGGQRQRLCIARALTLSPKLLILDEPTSALDVSTQKQILMLLDKLQKEKNIAYLLITHNLSVVAYLADNVGVMYQGKMVEYGSAREVMLSPKHDYTKRLLHACMVYTDCR